MILFELGEAMLVHSLEAGVYLLLEYCAMLIHGGDFEFSLGHQQHLHIFWLLSVICVILSREVPIEKEKSKTKGKKSFRDLLLLFLSGCTRQQ